MITAPSVHDPGGDVTGSGGALVTANRVRSGTFAGTVCNVDAGTCSRGYLVNPYTRETE